MIDQETIEWMRKIWASDWGKDLMGYEITMRELEKGQEPLPKNTCGQCAAYKTPFCLFANFHDVINNSDHCCVSFYPDRHIPRDKLKKPRVVQRKVE